MPKASRETAAALGLTVPLWFMLDQTGQIRESAASRAAAEWVEREASGYLRQEGVHNVAIAWANVNLADEMTTQMVISKYNAFNIAALKTSNEMLKSVLDIVA